MRFASRESAADLLVTRLAAWRGARPLVLGVARGAVPMARRIATALGGDCDAVVVRKLGMPGFPEYALGAIDASGEAVFQPGGEVVTAAERARVIAAERPQLAARLARYGPRANPSGRVVIVVDDGAATGSTLVAALSWVKKAGAARRIAAVPVASREAARWVRANADQAVILDEPPGFHAVAEFYDDFREVSDDEVVRLLDRPTP
jgi:putative phosphoribosyl transferase